MIIPLLTQQRFENTPLLSLWIFEAMLVFTLIGILSAIAIKDYSRTINITIVTSALSESWPVKSEIYSFYAKNGDWPDLADLNKLEKHIKESKLIEQVRVKSGSFDIIFGEGNSAIGGKTLSFRKAQFAGLQGTPVLWVCGFRNVPQGMSVNVENHTTISIDYMPQHCR